ncbi:MAG TPA: hypothetical protein VGL58_18230 [Caulobacteraceae bacterium]
MALGAGGKVEVSRALRNIVRAVVVLAVAAAAASASAESELDRHACIPSVLRLCPRQAMMGDRDGAMRCLFARLAEASAECQAVVRGNAPAVAMKAPTEVSPPVRQNVARAG